jgi:ATP-dependent exoDNAse (exonuclease V) beta subunit
LRAAFHLEHAKGIRAALRNVGRRADAYRIDGARIGTIHTFCADVLREFALRTGRAPSPQLVEDAWPDMVLISLRNWARGIGRDLRGSFHGGFRDH